MWRAVLSLVASWACIDPSAPSRAVIRVASWLSAGCLDSSAAILASSGARFGGCRCCSADTRASSGARSGAAGADAVPCKMGRCSSAVTRVVSGPRSAACGGGRCSRRATRASNAPSWRTIASVWSADWGATNGYRQTQASAAARIRKPAPVNQGSSRYRGAAASVGGAAGGSPTGTGICSCSVGSVIAAAPASHPGWAVRRRRSAARGAPVMPRRRPGR